LRPIPPAPCRAETQTAPVFLAAEWRDLIVANYAVPLRLLQPFIPAGTEPDLWNQRTYVSLVGFRFLSTKVFGLGFPFHRHFEEVNLRFYVRRKVGNEWRRGVVFIQEIVPRRAIAWMARILYNENYIARPMSHRNEPAGPDTRLVAYSWNPPAAKCEFSVTAQTGLQPLAPGSEAEFILEHYWGYSRQRNGSTMEYQVEHPSWRTQTVLHYAIAGNFQSVYGPAFGGILQAKPISVFLAEGSPVTVRRGVRLP
jgi:uncharacterized protein YqjF (DUF2071 family)